jgi:hypothetical protein
MRFITMLQRVPVLAPDGQPLMPRIFTRNGRTEGDARGHHWVGQVQITAAPFRVISRPDLFRRQLHFENPVSNALNNRKRKGGTITPFGFRSGDKVRAEKADKTYIGWIGGYTQTSNQRKYRFMTTTGTESDNFLPIKFNYSSAVQDFVLPDRLLAACRGVLNPTQPPRRIPPHPTPFRTAYYVEDGESREES